ncbi:hypothetical protein GCM10009117_17570 [Gangjinia marincola]|uniref:UspA domain-containing protein n=1 Tax=Gangjinia marincola TaxID=578463 RepID=A0ABP3XW01_9FLAO
MKNILVPIGSSPGAESCLQYAIDFAEVFDANVYVVSVFKQLSKAGGLSKVNTLLKEESEERLTQVMNKVDQRDVHVIAHPIKGEVVEGVERFNRHIPVDLMILSPRSNSKKDEVYLGKTSGKLIKQTTIPALIVPDGYTFKPAKNILMAFKNGNFTRQDALLPLRQIKTFLHTTINVLQVITPDHQESYNQFSKELMALTDNISKTENATTYQGVLEHFQSNQPDMLCVVRRKRGFFTRLWEKDVILKREFFTTIPLLILSGN